MSLMMSQKVKNSVYLAIPFIVCQKKGLFEAFEFFFIFIKNAKSLTLQSFIAFGALNLLSLQIRNDTQKMFKRKLNNNAKTATGKH